MIPWCNTLTCDNLQHAIAAGFWAKPSAGDAIAALLKGGLGSFRLAHAEAAAQEALLSRGRGAAQLDPCRPRNARTAAVAIVQDTATGLTPVMARILAKRGLVGPLLQVTSCATLCSPALRLQVVVCTWAGIITNG